MSLSRGTPCQIRITSSRFLYRQIRLHLLLHHRYARLEAKTLRSGLPRIPFTAVPPSTLVSFLVSRITTRLPRRKKRWKIPMLLPSNSSVYSYLTYFFHSYFSDNHSNSNTISIEAIFVGKFVCFLIHNVLKNRRPT